MSRIQSSPDRWKKFPDGPLVFLVERRTTELVAWLQGHEDTAVAVPVSDSSELLRVRPYYWSTNMPAEFRRELHSPTRR